jgi:hypothetical protein
MTTSFDQNGGNLQDKRRYKKLLFNCNFYEMHWSEDD